MLSGGQMSWCFQIFHVWILFGTTEEMQVMLSAALHAEMRGWRAFGEVEEDKDPDLGKEIASQPLVYLSSQFL